MDSKLVIVVLVALIQQISGTSVICYHGTWSHYRPGNGQFDVSDVPANLCTHYIYTFVGLDPTTYELITLDSELDFDLNGFADAAALRNQNPDLKVILAVGGWNEGSAKYSDMAANASTRTTFVNSALQWVQQYNFDGFDLDWEYPARRDSTNPDTDKENFVELLKEFHEVFHPLGLLVTAAVSAVPSSVDISYDVPALSKYLDFINVMLYDFHGAWDTMVAHNAPLYSAAQFDGTVYAEYSVNVSVQGWLSRGACPSKLALGVPFYGRTYMLANSSNTAPGSAAIGSGGPAGPYTGTPGFWGYNEIIEQFNAGGWTKAWDDEQQVPYAFTNTTWLSYDNEKSLAIKIAYAKSLGIEAIMLWSVETEDFHGLSGTQYPLLKTINNGLSSNSPPVSSSSTKKPTKTTTKTTAASTSSSASTTSSPSQISDQNSCTAQGYFGSSTDFSVFYYCQLNGSSYVAWKFTCSAGLYYDTTLGVCNYQTAV